MDLAVVVACSILAGAPPGMAAGFSLVLLVAFHVGGAYRDRSSLETQGLLWFPSVIATPMAVTILGAVSLAQIFHWSVRDVLVAGAMSFGGIVAVRAITCAVLAVARRKGLGLHPTLIVGDSRQASLLSKKLTGYPGAGLIPVAVMPLANGHGFSRYIAGFPTASQLSHAIQDSGAKHVILAPAGTDETILECVKGTEDLDVAFSILPPLSELFLHPRMVTQVGGLPLIPLGRIARGRTALPGKRLFDLTVASVLLLLISPLLAAIAMAIKIAQGGPVIYRQRRVGRYGTVFYMLKFRSMVPGAERMVVDLRDQNTTNGLLFKINDDPRVTPLGRIMRRLSIDELPQLWNVIRGEMSLVGPRPLAVNPGDFNAIDGKRHTVPPGITGYWQVAGDNALTYEEMIRLDLAYVENWSLWLDVHLLVRTIPTLLSRRGPY